MKFHIIRCLQFQLVNFHSAQMAEDEQILLQNLSNFLPSPIPQPTSTSQSFLLDSPLDQKPQPSTIITEKQKKRQYFVDWSNLENHDYFTRNVKDIESMEDIGEEEIVAKENQEYYERDYKDLAWKLEIALNRIKQNNQKKEASNRVKRSQSIQPRKEREHLLFSRPGKGFRETSAKHSKKSTHGRVKTQAQEQSFTTSHPTQGLKIQKYQIRHIITQQHQKQYSKQNTLKNNFLVSMALWQQKKAKRIQERIQKERKLSMEGVTFTPEINAKSREIMKRKGVIAPIYQRQCRQRQKKRELTQRFNLDYKSNKVKT